MICPVLNIPRFVTSEPLEPTSSVKKALSGRRPSVRRLKRSSKNKNQIRTLKERIMALKNDIIHKTANNLTENSRK